MTRRTKALQFDRKTRERIKERDGGCIFCILGYRRPNPPLPATDIMHIVSRAHGGLGIEQNGVYGCRYHHEMLDNGNKGERAGMMKYIEGYMKRHYEGWNRKDLVYRKDHI